jgi:hypothetical protein
MTSARRAQGRARELLPEAALEILGNDGALGLVAFVDE